MRKVTVNKNELLAIIRENREAHRGLFDEALKGYHNQAVQILEEHIARIRDGAVTQVKVAMPCPEDHTHDYDRAIKMVEMSVDDEITLEEHDFQCYVMDDWSWKREFLTTASTYVTN